VDFIAPLLEICLTRGLDCDRDRLGLAQFAPGRLGEQVLVEGPILAAARHPHIAASATLFTNAAQGRMASIARYGSAAASRAVINAAPTLAYSRTLSFIARPLC